MQKDTLCYCTSNRRQKVSRERGQKLSSLEWVSNLSLQLLFEKPRICCQEHPKWLLAQCWPQQLQQITHGNAFDIYSAPWKDLPKCRLLGLSQEQFSHLGRIVRGPIPHQISNSPFKGTMYFFEARSSSLSVQFFCSIQRIQVLLMALPGRLRSRRKRFRWPRREASGMKDSTTWTLLKGTSVS